MSFIEFLSIDWLIGRWEKIHVLVWFLNVLVFLLCFQPIFFNDDVLPICLGSGTPPPPLTDCFVTGWGSTAARPMPGYSTPGPINMTKNEEILDEKATDLDRESRAVNPLRQVDVRIVRQEECVKQYMPYAGPPFNMKITDDMICGYNSGKDRYERQETTTQSAIEAFNILKMYFHHTDVDIFILTHSYFFTHTFFIIFHHHFSVVLIFMKSMLFGLYLCIFLFLICFFTVLMFVAVKGTVADPLFAPAKRTRTLGNWSESFLGDCTCGTLWWKNGNWKSLTCVNFVL